MARCGSTSQQGVSMERRVEGRGILGAPGLTGQSTWAPALPRFRGRSRLVEQVWGGQASSLGCVKFGLVPCQPGGDVPSYLDVVRWSWEAGLV